MNAHKAYEQSRRDDLESIGNILVYICRGGWLPWMTMEDSGENKDQLKVKEKTTLEELC